MRSTFYNRIRELRAQAIFLGVKDGMHPEKIKEISITNEGAILCSLSTLIIAAFVQVWVHIPAISVILLVIAGLYLVVLALHAWRKYLFTKIYFSVVVNGAVCWTATSLGYGSGVHYLYFVLIFGVVLVTDIRFPQLRMVLISVPIIMLGISLLINYVYPNAYGLSIETQHQIRYLIFPLAMMCTLGLGISFSANTKKQNEYVALITATLAEQNEALLHTNNQLDEFVYRVSSDLRAPLASVLGLIEVIRSERELEKIHAYFDMQEASVQHLDVFIVDLLQISRNARTELAQDEISFSSLIHEIQQEYTYLPQANNIQKRVHIQQKAPFVSDRQRIRTILSNLISNGMHYWDSEKALHYIEITGEINERGATIMVHDNGKGIDKAHLPHLFSMFFKVNPHPKSSGLGLFLVRATLEKLGGSIEVESVAGEFTTFKLFIPNARFGSYAAAKTK